MLLFEGIFWRPKYHYHCHHSSVFFATPCFQIKFAGIFPSTHQCVVLGTTGNCFRMARIVLKITFLELRYPKGVTGSVPLCPIMALGSIAAWISVEHKMRRSYKDDRTSGRVDVFSVERGRQNTYKGFEYFSQGHDQESWGKHLFLL